MIASGGVGNLDHLADGVQQGGADAVLASISSITANSLVGQGQGPHGRTRYSRSALRFRSVYPDASVVRLSLLLAFSGLICLKLALSPLPVLSRL